MPRREPRRLAPDGGYLYNSGFECGPNGENVHIEPGQRGVVPNGWTAAHIGNTDPNICTTQTWDLHESCNIYACNPSASQFEKLDGHDSLLFSAKDIIAWPGTSVPYGKPYDLAVYQRFAAVPGTAYSFSAWFLDLCGGGGNLGICNSNSGPYQLKVAGIDPYGGTDPLSPNVIQVQSKRTGLEVGRAAGLGERAWWENLATAATAREHDHRVPAREQSFYAGRQSRHAGHGPPGRRPHRALRRRSG